MTSEPATTGAVETKGGSGATVQGDTAPGFEPVRSEFARLLAVEGDCSGQFCAYLHGRKVVDLWGGPDVSPDDLLGVFSSTKGVSGICMALLAQRGLLDLDAPVSRYWPEFAAGGKGGVTVRLALSHQAGLAAVDPPFEAPEDAFDHALSAARLAAQVPQWSPGASRGYHSMTLGTIMDELCRRTAGVPLAQFFREELGPDYPFGSYQAFGHDGAGGSLAVADPWYGLAYAWIPRRMTVPGGADARGILLAKLTRQSAADLAEG